MSREKSGYSPEADEKIDEKAEMKKIRELIRLFLSLQKSGVGNKAQLEQVRQRLSEALDRRMKRMVSVIERAYGTMKGVSINLLDNADDRATVKREMGIDVSVFPYVVRLDTEDGIADLAEYYSTGRQEE